MPETEVTGTPQAATPPAPVPADVDAKITSQVRDAVRKASDSIRSTQPPTPATPAKEPETPASTTTDRLLTKEAPKPAESKVELGSIDWSKQSPEIQALRKELLGDYTRKTQELSEGRKSLLEEREKFVTQMMEKLNPKTDAPPSADPMETIRQLREEGRHEEADKLLIEASNKMAEERVSVLERQAEINNRKTLFRDTVSETFSQSPVVNAFKGEVTQIWEGENPVMKEIREAAVSSPERIKTWVPAIFHFLAVEQHAMKLERSFDERLKAGIEAGIKAEKDRAAGIRGSVVPSGGESRETPAPKTADIRSAVRMASAQLRGE